MKNISLIFIAFIAFHTSLAQNWTGAVSSDWNNSANWTALPTNGADITIDPINYTGGAFSPIISTNSTFNVGAMDLLNGAVLTINANLTTLDDVNVLDPNSEIIVNQGTFDVNLANGGRCIADFGGKITVNGGSVNVGERLISGADAQIIINNGNVTTNERFLMDLGGQIIINNGNVVVGQVMALADGDVNGSSYFEQNGGVITITGEVALENEAGNFQPTIMINAGTFNLNGDLVWFGAVPGTGTPHFITTGGIVNINGNISNLVGSTVNMLFDISGSSIVNFNGISIDLINPTDSIKQWGNSEFNLAGTHNWNNEGVFYATDGIVLCDGTTNLLGTGMYQFNHLTVATAKTLNHTSPFEIFIGGNFAKLGSFNPANNKVTFNGNTAQTISGTALFNFASVEINNSTGVTLNHPVFVDNTLTLTNGLFHTSSTNLLTLTTNASASAGSNLSFVNGPMKKIGNTAFVFPIGKNNNWRRLGISAPSNTTSELTAEYFENSAPNTSVFNSPLSAVSSLEYWQIEKSNPADAPTIELYWEDANQSGISDCAATTMAHYNGTSWDNVNSTASGICTGNGSGSILSNSAQNDLGLFTFGYFGNVVSQTITLCFGGSLTVGSNTYTSSGHYIDVLTASNNDDSTVITNLTILPLLTGTQNVEICFGTSFTIGTSTYTASGNYTDTLVSSNNCDSVVTTNLTVMPLLTGSQDVEICFGTSYSIGTSTYTTSGNYTDTLVSSNNCDSVVTTNLTVMPLLTGSQDVEICFGTSYSIGTSTYTTSGNYTDTLVSSNNCDSVVTTNLTVMPLLTGSQDVEICFGTSFTIGTSTYTTSGNYTDTLVSSNNCDSVVTTNLTVLPTSSSSQNIEICFGESFTIGNSTYTVSGNYTDTFVAFNGCDSIVTTNLTVANEIDVTTTVLGNTISANNTTATSYQWLDCNNNNVAISGEVNPTFLPATNGNYAVEITEGLCKDTSICTVYNSVGINDEYTLSTISIFPNPSNGIFTITTNSNDKMGIEIYNTMGKLILKMDLVANQTTIDLSKQAKGIYFAVTSSGNNRVSQKIVIE